MALGRFVSIHSLLFLLGFLLVGCSSVQAPPQNINNICSIFREYPDWYKAAKRSQNKWKVPVPVQMAIVRYESDFIADARPPRTKLLWVIPWKYQSTAYGYSQALDGTWKGYVNGNNRYFADRDDFEDAIDFVGWYTNNTYRTLGIDRKNAYALYLAYHEGLGGYQRGSYWKKKWLRGYAKQVEKRAIIYEQQLSRCEPALKKQTANKSFFFWG